MPDLRGGVIGCGFFARNHLHAWHEIEGIEIAAVCDVDAERANAFARAFGVRAAYRDAEQMLRREALDFVDIVTQPAAHRALVERAAGHRTHVICQKPLADSLDDARAMVEACRAAGVRFMVHESFRWQRPMRALKEAAADLGDLFFARITFRTAYDIYTVQPYLAEDSRFIIADVGVHLLDLARFFLGEAEQLYCRTRRINPTIKGEDAATLLLEMRGGATCVVELSYHSKLEEDLFPQTLVHLEGTRGSAVLGPHYQLTVTGEGGVSRRSVAPAMHAWSAPPGYAVQDSVPAIQRHWAECLREGREPETSGADNLRTLEMVFGAYASAETGIPYTVSEMK